MIDFFSKKKHIQESEKKKGKLKRNELPVQVRCMILDAWGWCTGMTQRDSMGRRKGGSEWETDVYQWWIHVDI